MLHVLDSGGTSLSTAEEPSVVKGFSPSLTDLWRTYKATGQRLDQVAAMAGPYAIVEREMLQRRRAAIAQHIQALTRRRRSLRSGRA